MESQIWELVIRTQQRQHRVNEESSHVSNKLDSCGVEFPMEIHSLYFEGLPSLQELVFNWSLLLLLICRIHKLDETNI